ncbi:hypothetical protein [Kibdelosporangium philippinense]|uniref:hypothetical protein n=1 Tax=Kibdelosporangium philippinense TaxID=211113 RepID=UPI00360923BE
MRSARAVDRTSAHRFTRPTALRATKIPQATPLARPTVTSSSFSAWQPGNHDKPSP